MASSPAPTPPDTPGLAQYAVVGNPVAHSRSPSIHAMFAAQTGQAMDYTRLLAPMDGFSDTVRAWVAGGLARGCNVTVPFKFEAYAMAATRTARATLAQAANTLIFPSADPATWQADNTDGAGLVRDITVNAGVQMAGRSVLLVGAGGASAGVLGPVIAQRPAQICVSNRTVQKAQDLVNRHQAWAEAHGVRMVACALDDALAAQPTDIIINGTAASLQGGEFPISPTCIKVATSASSEEGSLVLDMMYGPAAEPFLAWARSHGARTRDGLGMLVEQAAESFWLWRGVRPDTATVMARMR